MLLLTLLSLCSRKKEKVSDKVAPTINQTVTGNGNTVIGIQNNMKGKKDGQ